MDKANGPRTSSVRGPFTHPPADQYFTTIPACTVRAVMR
jgi:hypothetical protein